MKQLFTRHTREQQMSYWQHFFRAQRFAWLALINFWVAMIHSIFPFWYISTYSDNVLKLAEQFKREAAQRSTPVGDDITD